MGDHRELTRMAFDTLPERDRALWAGHADDVIREYCCWPDRWLNAELHEQIDPYQLVIDGIQFHYPPMSHPDYLYWGMTRTPTGPRPQPILQSDNPHWRFFEQGARHYLTTIVDDLARNRTADAAKRLGILLHFFQDTHTLHALEGPWGTDCFIIDRLLDLPQDGPHELTALDLLDKTMRTEGDITHHAPRLEGTTIGEAVFRLYQRYVDSALENRKLHVPLVYAAMEHDEPRLDALYRQLHERLARLTADVVHTVSALAHGTFDAGDTEHLQVVHLDELEPLRRPWIIPGPYRFSAMVRGACLDAERRRHPLQLRQSNGSVQTFERGWGGGAHVAPLPIVHELPAGVYRQLQGQVGLHAEFGRGGCVQIAIELDGQTLVREEVSDGSPTVVIDVPVEQGGPLHLTAWRDPDGAGEAASANLAWGDVRLLK